MTSGASAVTDPEGALMVTNAIKSIIGADEDGEDTGAVGLEVTNKAVDATEVRDSRFHFSMCRSNISWWLMHCLAWRSHPLTTSSRP